MFVATNRMAFGIVLTLVFGVVITGSAFAQRGAEEGEWRYYGGDAGTTKYSPLDQIDRENVADLQIAWRWRTDNFGPRVDFNYQATPLMVGGVLYTTAGWRRNVAAIDGATGETLWMYRYDEGERGDRAPVRASSGRGVAYWTDGQGDERIIHVTKGYHLVALSATTGQPVPAFGEDGVVDLYQGLFDGLDRPVVEDGQIGLNSPAMVVGDVIVVGAALRATAPAPEFPAGFVRGFDARTGAQLWTFHTIPQAGELGNDTWENGSWRYSGNTGVWAPMSADIELGYVYLPVETPTNDLYGGHRPGDNLFAESLVCLDARTGERVWHFQFVHHGIWDYDIPTAPTLVDLTVGGRTVKAVAQVTKQAFTYVFDRVTGEPLWPIEERPVAPSTVPGEQASPTQPFPTRPLPFDSAGGQHRRSARFHDGAERRGAEDCLRVRVRPPVHAPDPGGGERAPRFAHAAQHDRRSELAGWGGGRGDRHSVCRLGDQPDRGGPHQQSLPVHDGLRGRWRPAAAWSRGAAGVRRDRPPRSAPDQAPVGAHHGHRPEHR